MADEFNNRDNDFLLTRVTYGHFRGNYFCEQKLLTIPEHSRSPLYLSGVRIAQSFNFCVVFCRPNVACIFGINFRKPRDLNNNKRHAHFHGHFWHSNSVMINQVMMATVKSCSDDKLHTTYMSTRVHPCILVGFVLLNLSISV
jgi:hypothetical protein